MSRSSKFLSPSEAARRLGVSIKALRVYEHRGLVAPSRTDAGWRVYGPDEMARAGEIVALRALGLSLAAIGVFLDGDPAGLEPVLAAHQASLESRVRELVAAIDKVRELRTGLIAGSAPTVGEVAGLMTPAGVPRVAFELPWPWGGEHFELRDIRPLNYIVGPLGSGKTRLAHRIAETLPGAVFLGLDRLDAGDPLAAIPASRARLDHALAWMVDEGAPVTPALVALLLGLDVEGASAVVVDMVEQGLEQAAQEALIAHLRRRGPAARPLFLLTRSSAILDLAAVGDHESILFCPANHSPPMRVAANPGASGYEAVASCLASPAVRARTEGVVAWRPDPCA